jgi:hypothetical protein
MEQSRWHSLPGALAALALVAVAVCPCCLLAEDYVYADDFSSDRALLDSYSHSEFLEELPEPWPVSGFLIYESYISHRTLSFYCGTGSDAYAWLRYRFPLEQGPGGFTSATVELTLEDNRGYGWIQCGSSLEGGSPWEWPTCGDEGTCLFEFESGTPVDTVYIWLRGCPVSIDDLVVTLSGSTPVERDTWARIKGLLGGPSD